MGRGEARDAYNADHRVYAMIDLYDRPGSWGSRGVGGVG